MGAVPTPCDTLGSGWHCPRSHLNPVDKPAGTVPSVGVVCPPKLTPKWPLSFSMISGGVPLHTPKPYQALLSRWRDRPRNLEAPHRVVAAEPSSSRGLANSTSPGKLSN